MSEGRDHIIRGARSYLPLISAFVRVQSEILRQSQIFILFVAVLLLASVGLHVLRYNIKQIVAPARKAKRHNKGPIKTDDL